MSWLRPQNLQQALEWLDQYRPQIVCGGTDLFVNWPRRQFEQRRGHWLDVRNLPELNRISRSDDGLEIGAAVTAAEIWQNPVFERVRALQQAARVVGGWQIQNRASLGGNIANASPAADMVIPLVAFDAHVRLRRKSGVRNVPVGAFITGPRQTDLKPDELIEAIVIPRPSLQTESTFVRLDQRGATDISIVSAAVVLSRNEDGRVDWGRTAVGAAHAVPLTLPDVDTNWKGTLSPDKVKQIAQAYAEACRPISDVRASAEYRRAMVEVYVQRAARQLIS